MKSGKAFYAPLFPRKFETQLFFQHASILITSKFRDSLPSVPLRDRQMALQLLLEIDIQMGSLHSILQTVQLLFDLWDSASDTTV